ncbi:uncharacterized protein [Antedon mediterranea]|uniref:uncharacterized protein isoform X2 n=1 Tax=Antedon mediterranea TaxID=105859 RepID=UPI003AF52A18
MEQDIEESDNNDQQLTDEELQILAEQIAVERELQQMKEEGYLPVDDPPEYNVRDRIAQLNAELAAEGTIVDNRRQSVQFREDPVSDVFPVIYYEDDDVDAADEQEVNNEEDIADKEVAKLTLVDSIPGIERQTFIQREQMPKKSLAFAETKEETTSKEVLDLLDDEEKVVVEREGKFEVVDASDLTTEERHLMGLGPVTTESTSTTLPNINNSGSHSIHELRPLKQRPSTATYSGNEKPNNPPTRRIQSARPVNKKTSYQPITVKKVDPFRDGTISDFGNQKSRYGQTDEQKEYQRKMARLRRDQLREETQKKEEEERRLKSDSEQAFHAWMQQKQEDTRAKKKIEKEKKKNESETDPNKPDPDDVFKSWLQGKKRQSNLEKRFHKHFEEENKQGQQQRSREECEKTYKAWVRSKNYQLREQQSLSRAHALTSKHQIQRSRKSRTLAKALQVAQTYRYTDYYGYRF